MQKQVNFDWKSFSSSIFKSICSDCFFSGICVGAFIAYRRHVFDWSYAHNKLKRVARIILYYEYHHNPQYESSYYIKSWLKYILAISILTPTLAILTNDTVRIFQPYLKKMIKCGLLIWILGLPLFGGIIIGLGLSLCQRLLYKQLNYEQKFQRLVIDEII